MYWKQILLVSLVLALVSGCATKTKQEFEDKEDMVEKVNPFQDEFNQALQLMHQGKLELARVKLTAIHEKAPVLSGPMLNLALIAVQMKENSTAREWLDKVLALMPNHPVALTYSGLLAREEGMFALAEQNYRKALAGSPDYTPAIRNLAILLDLYRGKPEQALPLYERYQELQKTPDPQVNDWIFDLKQRLEAQAQ